MSLYCLSLLLLLFSLIIFRASNKEIGQPLDTFNTHINLTLILLSFGLFVGIIVGNPANEILSNLFPFIEAISFFLISSVIIKSESDISFVLKGIYIWIVGNFVLSLMLYFSFGGSYEVTIAFFGITIPRLNDMMVSILLPFLFVFLFFGNTTQKIKYFFPFFLGLCILLLGFFRTNWLAVFISLVFNFK